MKAYGRTAINSSEQRIGVGCRRGVRCTQQCCKPWGFLHWLPGGPSQAVQVLGSIGRSVKHRSHLEHGPSPRPEGMSSRDLQWRDGRSLTGLTVCRHRSHRAAVPLPSTSCLSKEAQLDPSSEPGWAWLREQGQIYTPLPTAWTK